MTAYDEILYPTLSFPQTHPNRLATHAELCGLSPAPLEGCRVLEIGCGDGGNLIPMVCDLPGAEFVGIDPAARPVAAGQELIDELGLANVRLHAVGVEELTEDFGAFDYIVAHGVYSWVPPRVQDEILAACRRHLSPCGVAFVSYNALPGGHLRSVTRDMMRWHVRRVRGPLEKVERARAFLELIEPAFGESEPFDLVFRQELSRIAKFHPSYLVHDDLSDFGTPIYFHEFAEHAARHGLQYLAEADYSSTADHALPRQAGEALRQLAGDRLELEQYADFIRGRKFRQTLLCHADAAPARDRTTEEARAIAAAAARRLYVSAPLRPRSDAPDVRSRAVEEFRSAGEASLSTDSPLVKAAALVVGRRWPQAVHFAELLEEARTLSGARDGGEGTRREEDAGRLASILVEAYAAGAVRLHERAPNLVTRVSERPATSALARAQLRRGPFVTNQYHASTEIKDPLSRHLFMLLDGTRDTDALVAELSEFVRRGGARAAGAGEGEPVEPLLATLHVGLGRNLEWLGANALLVA